MIEPRGFWGSPGCISKAFPLEQEIAIHAFTLQAKSQKEASNFSYFNCYHCSAPHRCDRLLLLDSWDTCGCSCVFSGNSQRYKPWLRRLRTSMSEYRSERRIQSHDRPPCHLSFQELSKITMPVIFNEPLSFLQRLAEYMEHTFLVHQANACSDSVERMKVGGRLANGWETLQKLQHLM